MFYVLKSKLFPVKFIYRIQFLSLVSNFDFDIFEHRQNGYQQTDRGRYNRNLLLYDIFCPKRTNYDILMIAIRYIYIQLWR